MPGKLLATLLAAAVLAGGVLAGDFQIPADGPVAFRRDRVQLTPDAMKHLAEELVTLADGMDAPTPALRRGAAQTLALALALDPANSQVRGVMDAFAAGAHQPQPPADTNRLRRDLWKIIGWLHKPEAGAESNALAACLDDVMAATDPAAPLADATLVAAQKGAWQGWIPPLAAYRPAPAAEETAAEEETPGLTIQLESATVTVPLTVTGGKGAPVPWTLQPAVLEMNAHMAAETESGVTAFSIIFSTEPAQAILRPLVPRIRKALTQRHGPLPNGGVVDIGGAALDESVFNKAPHQIAAGIAVLASAALTGRAPDAAVIGDFDENGELTLPADFWDQFRAFRGGKGRRLVVPAAAAPYIPSMLALERPEFFLNNHVLLAGSYAEMLDLSAAEPSPELARAIAGLKDIRDKRGSKSVGPYLANTFVRKRLAELGREAPYDQSMRMLAIHGAGDRPIFVIKPVLASEIRNALAPMMWVVQGGSSFLADQNIDRLGTTYDLCRGQVDGLARYADPADRAAVAHAADLVATIRPLERAAKARDVLTTTPAMVEAYTAMTTAYATVVADLAALEAAAPR